MKSVGSKSEAVASEGNKMGRNRPSNLEVLRIVVMLAIVGNHLAVHGAIPINSLTEPLDFKYWFAQALACGGKFGADVFVLISGYFLVGCKPKISGLAKLWLRMVAIGLMAVGLSVGCGGAFAGAGDLTAYAHWRKVGMVLTVDPNGGRYLGSVTPTVMESPLMTGTTLLGTIGRAYCGGFELLGFFDAPEGGEMVYDATGRAVKGSYWAESRANGGVFCGASDLVVYAHWK